MIPVAAAAAVGVAGAVVGAWAVHRAGTVAWAGRVPDAEAVLVGADGPDVRGGAPAPRPARPVAVPVLGGVLTGLLFAAVVVRFGGGAASPAFLLLAAAAVPLAVVDLRHRLLPDRIVLPLLAAGSALLLLAAALDGAWTPALRALLGAVVLFAAFLGLALVAPAGLGMGDVKLAAVLGLYLGWLGWDQVLLGAVAGFLVQAVVALALLATRRIGLRGELPFGPAMLAGALLVAVVAPLAAT